jgi:phage recombination protein Bet
MTTDTRSLQTSFVDPEVSAAIQIYDRLQPLQDALGLAKLTVPEMQLFAMVAHHTGLDPFTKQIYAIKRGGKVVHQTGIDGYRSTAERTSQYRGSDAPVFEACECAEKDSPTVHPKIARVTVYRAYPDGIRPQIGEARWHELKPKHTKGDYGYTDDMWWQMPENQLAKCAEANGLRKAFPRVLGGVYIAEEMEQAGPGDSTALVAAAGQPTAAERIAARRAALEAAETSVAADGEALFVEGEAVEIDTEPEAAPVSGGCGWSLLPRGSDTPLPCTFGEMHGGEHSFTEEAVRNGGRVVPPAN